MSTHRQRIEHNINNGRYEEYKTLSICKINDYYRMHDNKIKYQVHNESHKHSFSMLYENIDEAIDKFFDLKRKIR